MVRVLSTAADLDGEINRLGSAGIIFIDFYADWCGPCRMIAPVYEELSRKYSNISFCKVNVDNSRVIAQRYSVNAMPTFVILKGGIEVERVQGANGERLMQLAAQYNTVSNPNAASISERAFLEDFTRQSDRYLLYYDNELYQTLAKSVIPSEICDLAENGLSLQVAVKLMHWFKTEFFQWEDTPECPKCGQRPAKAQSLSGTPTREEQEEGDAQRVEVYPCPCGGEPRFPRYNNPGKLLETRRGRCGEWANCFTLLATSLGFDTRFVYDTSDHVWTEIHVDNRWMHFDACEDSFDRPLVYELGWKKKLEYVMAFGRDHVSDVTWKYVAVPVETKQRRNKVRESLLSSFLEKLTVRLLARAATGKEQGWKEQREAKIKQEKLVDIIESMRIGPVDSTNYGGRQSGNVEWRKAREELGDNGETNEATTIAVSKDQCTDGQWRMEYDIVRDVYSIGGVDRKGWKAATKQVSRVQRKVENDWKKAYLCREEGSEEGTIEWEIDLGDIDVASVRISGGEFFSMEGGRVLMTACVGSACMMVRSGQTLEIPGEDMVDGKTLHLTVRMSGGTGDVAFQHAQLFRSALDAPNAPHLTIEVVLK